MKEYVKCDNFYIVGHSMGGPIALKLALLMPKKVIGVTIINSLRPDGYKSS